MGRVGIIEITKREVRNLGYLEIRDGTEENLGNAVLMENFKKAIGEHCLPFIVPGYAEV